MLILFNNTPGLDHESSKFWESIILEITVLQNANFLIDVWNYIQGEAAVLGYYPITWYYKFIGSIFYCYLFTFLYITLSIEIWCAMY